jgi:CRP/FNR family cyclic AMP-dependent transcriptional regulator
MQTHTDRTPMRVLIKKSGTPFTVTRYQRGETVFVQGDEGDSVMHVESGRVELTVVATCGREAICGLPGRGSFLGEEVIAGCAVRPYTATAMTPTEVISITKADMLHLLSSQPEFAERFVEYSVSRTTRLAADLANQLLYTSETRLAHVLLSLADHQEGDSMRCALPDVTQEFIARMVGTTRSRVNMFLGKFKRMGFIEEHGGVLQINPALLADVSDGGSLDRDAR